MTRLEDLLDHRFGLLYLRPGTFVSFEESLNALIFKGLFILGLDLLSGLGETLHVAVDLLDVRLERSLHLFTPELLPVETLKPRMTVKLLDSLTAKSLVGLPLNQSIDKIDSLLGPLDTTGIDLDLRVDNSVSDLLSRGSQIGSLSNETLI